MEFSIGDLYDINPIRPNGEPTGQIRPFALPNFTPEIVKFEVNRSNGQVSGWSFY